MMYYYIFWIVLAITAMSIVSSPFRRIGTIEEYSKTVTIDYDLLLAHYDQSSYVVEHKLQAHSSSENQLDEFFLTNPAEDAVSKLANNVSGKAVHKQESKQKQHETLKSGVKSLVLSKEQLMTLTSCD